MVAWVDGTPVGAAAVAATARRRGIDARQALEELVVFEVLARAAAAAGVEPDGEDRAAARAAMVARLIEREIEPALAPAAISDAEVRQLYERGKKRYVHGRQVRTAVLCVFTGARMKPAPRARAEETARALAAAVGASAGRTAADFERIAADPVWVDRGVSLTTVWQGADDPFPRVVGDAVLALRRPGDTTALVGDETGHYIARYLDERPPENVGYEEAAPALRAEMYSPWRRQQFLRVTADLAGPHELEAFPERLAN